MPDLLKNLLQRRVQCDGSHVCSVDVMVDYEIWDKNERLERSNAIKCPQARAVGSSVAPVAE